MVSNLQLQTKHKVILPVYSVDISTAVFNVPELCILQFQQRSILHSSYFSVPCLAQGEVPTS